MTQLHLPISLEPNATFNNFYCSNNYTATMVHQLMDTEKPIVLCGKSGSGKTHLLHAICHQTPLRWLYLDCNNHKLTSPDILDNMEEKCVCLDNIHALAHVKKWEDGLFKLMLHHHRTISNKSSNMYGILMHPLIQTTMVMPSTMLMLWV